MSKPLQELRRCRYGYFLALHILLLYVRGKNPTEIADFLLCARSSVYRAIEDWQSGELQDQWWSDKPTVESEQTGVPSLFQRKLLWTIKQPPRAFGWCRTRWSCAALALTIAARTGLQVSRETIRRELRAAGYVWKRAKLKAKDDDPQRARRLAKIRAVIEQLRPSDAFFWCDELDVHLLAKVGYQWMIQGTQIEVPTPGKNQKQYLAAALDYRTGQIHYVIGKKKDNALFRVLAAKVRDFGTELCVANINDDNDTENMIENQQCLESSPERMAQKRWPKTRRFQRSIQPK